MKTLPAITLIMIVSGVITAIMINSEMDTFTYIWSGKLSATSFLPLVFGIIMSIVVAAIKKDDKP